VRGLLREFAAGRGPARVTVLANRPTMEAYAELQRGPVSLHEMRSYRAGRSIPSRALAMGWARLAPGRIARDVPEGLDLVHYPVTVPIPATETPRVVTVHDLQHHDLPGFFSRAERRYRRWAYDGAARAADVVVTTSDYTRGRLIELLGIAPSRVEAVPHGVDHERFRPEPSESDSRLLARHDLPESFVYYPANLWPHKNHARLIEAMAQVPDLGLVMTGQDYGRLDELRSAVRRLRLEGRVRHLGHVAPDVVPALMRSALALVFPSLYEGFGAPPLEAMACGCPVAASDRTSIPEVCGDAALLFDPESAESIAGALEQLRSQEELRERLRSAGLERARLYSWEAAAARHTAIYERAAATSQTGGPSE
jgi:glycosyltransferase involved in cell wall biosynthesis